MLYNTHSGDFYMQKQFEKQRGGFGLSRFFLSTLISLATLLIIAFIFSLIAVRRENSAATTAPYALISIVASGVISGFINSKRVGIKRAILSSVMCALLLMIIGILISKSAPGLSAFMNYLTFVLTSLVGSYLGRGGSKRRRRKHRYSR